MAAAGEPARQYLTVSQVAGVTGYSLDTVRRAIHRGDLPASKQGGGTFRIREADVEMWMADARIAVHGGVRAPGRAVSREQALSGGSFRRLRELRGQR